MKRKHLFLILVLLVGLAVMDQCRSRSVTVTGDAKSNYRSFPGAKELQAYMGWHPGRVPLISAHRGGPMGSYPENALETFENALTFAPCLIECDVRITKDGHLVMMHDTTLDRTTTGKGKVTDYTLEQIKQLFLKDIDNRVTKYRIPTLGETFQWACGRAILTIDVKSDVRYRQVISEIRRNKAEGHSIIIVYNIEGLLEVHHLAPDLMISAYVTGIKSVERMFATGIPAKNLTVFVGVYEPDLKVYEALHQKNIRTILGTMHNLDKKAAVRGVSVYQKLYRSGADILSTDNVSLVSRAIGSVDSRQ